MRRLALTIVAVLAAGTPVFAQDDAYFLKEYGARAPLSCEPLRTLAPPTAAQAADLVRCRHETFRGGELWLMKDVRVRIGEARDYLTVQNINIDHVDISKPVYLTTGSFTWSKCNDRDTVVFFGKDPDFNCNEDPVADATGACWYTTFSDWQCSLGGAVTGYPQENMPPIR